VGPTQSNEFRSPKVEMLFGDDPWVSKKENGILYRWNIYKCMFSSGNITEKQRIGAWDCSDEIIVDLFAGIGYFTLTYLKHAEAKHVYACEWNPDSVEALKINLQLNNVSDRCTVLFGDNRITAPKNVADRVNLGLLPSAKCSWMVACEALRKDQGGLLHIHENVDTVDCQNMNAIDSDTNRDTKSDLVRIGPNVHFLYVSWRNWAVGTADEICKMFVDLYPHQKWVIFITGIIKVKSYGPRIYHLVLDLKCCPQL